MNNTGEVGAFKMLEARIRSLEAERDAAVARAEAAEKLTGCQMTPEEAQAAYESAEPVPMSRERIEEIVEFATRDTRRIKELESALRASQAQAAAMRQALQVVLGKFKGQHPFIEAALASDAGKPLLAWIERAATRLKFHVDMGNSVDAEVLKDKP
jgi:alanyl-tRNA synthetase